MMFRPMPPCMHCTGWSRWIHFENALSPLFTKHGSFAIVCSAEIFMMPICYSCYYYWMPNMLIQAMANVCDWGLSLSCSENLIFLSCHTAHFCSLCLIFRQSSNSVNCLFYSDKLKSVFILEKDIDMKYLC